MRMSVRLAPAEVADNGQFFFWNNATKIYNSHYKVTLGVKPGYALTEWNLTG